MCDAASKMIKHLENRDEYKKNIFNQIFYTLRICGKKLSKVYLGTNKNANSVLFRNAHTFFNMVQFVYICICAVSHINIRPTRTNTQIHAKMSFEMHILSCIKKCPQRACDISRVLSLAHSTARQHTTKRSKIHTHRDGVGCARRKRRIYTTVYALNVCIIYERGHRKGFI